jgi:antitoxin component YwqK of YwqJK toxin-antitoxin module
MKTLAAVFIIFSSFISYSQEYEMNGRDTINMTDANGKKQGKWVISGSNKPTKGYKPGQKIEEGIYLDNKRIGIWKQYYNNGNLKSSITYLNGHPEGPTTMYHDNGTIKEEGTWKQNRWVGDYRSVDESGTTTEIVFDEKGKEVSKKITPGKKKK